MSAFVVAIGLLSASAARADFVGLLNVDFGEASPTFNGAASVTYSGPAVIGSAGDIWNGPEVLFHAGGHVSVGPLSMVDSTGASTGVTLGYTVTGAYKGTSVFGPPLDDLMTDYIYNRNDTGLPGSVTLSGLTPGGAYDLYLYSAGDSPKNTTFIVGTDTAIVSTESPNAPTSTFTSGVNYVKLSTTADPSGNLNILFKSTLPNDLDGVLNGLQLFASGEASPAPLPNVFVAGVAGLGLAYPARRWLKKRPTA